jgi:hypothetical protein
MAYLCGISTESTNLLLKYGKNENKKCAATTPSAARPRRPSRERFFVDAGTIPDRLVVATVVAISGDFL